MRKIAVTDTEKEVKTSKIKEVALSLFAERGYHQTTMSDIAAAAGVGRGTLYWYFPTKEELLIAAFRQEMEEMLAESKELAERKISPLEKLSLAMEELPRSLADHGDLTRVLFQVWSEGSEEMKQQIEAAWERLNRHDHALITRIIKECIEENIFRPVDPATVAATLIAFTDGLCYHWLFGFSQVESGGVEVARDIILRGLLK
ncbi:TetR/AcrR family transcriptional regulator [Candidatus Acetothermia bacterium]|jgi:TetR/AcrR family fatty acid metabolism transcriptional regulator|nr:TetR/AcrR family transcriptional regulator [Candidatus Acetothermia bacterium]MCI2427141.1 TetR/AcrR family transcriptional regulator [Candidatus Acetothermia bacterium]MCI2428663.1 TetR/AcrR family transcriptional regulator [Candidatus Acetothermia bacterium]